MKVSDWLEEHHSNWFFDDDELRHIFEEETGKQAPWEFCHTCSPEETVNSILLYGGELTRLPTGRTIAIHEVAVAAAIKFTPEGWSTKCIGRGSRYRECIARLRAFDL